MNINKLYPPPPLIKGRRRYLLKTEDVLPLGYTRLEYLESNGSQYIDTGFKPDQDSRIKLDIQVTKSATSFLFGARANSSANSASNSFSMPQISGSSLRMDYGSTETSIAINSLQILDIDVNKNVVTINGNVTTVPSQTFQSQYSLYLLSVNTAGTTYSTQTTAQIYSCEIYDNGMLVRNYIPCINESGKKGLYDTVNGTFEGLRGSQICTISEYNTYNEDLLGIQTDKPVTSDITISYVLYSGSYDTTGTVSWGQGDLTSVRITSGNQIETWQIWNSYSNISGIISVYPKYDDTYTYMISNPKIVNNISIVNKSDGKYIRFQYVPRSGGWVRFFTDFLVEIGQTEIPNITTDGVNRDFRITSIDDTAWIIDTMSSDKDYAFTWNNNEIK